MRDKQLFGIVVDVSSSMRKNFGSLSMQRKRIDVIREAINEEFFRIKSIRKIKNDSILDVFCLGIGFKSPLRLQSYSISDGTENPIDDIDTVLIGNICDIISLNKFIPSNEDIENLKLGISKFWSGTTEKFIDSQNTEEIGLGDLQSFVYTILTNEEKIKISFFRKVHSYLTEGKQKRKLELATDLSFYFSEEVGKKAEFLFEEYSDKYDNLIRSEITEFAKREIYLIIERFTLGFSLEQILAEFNVVKLKTLSDKIHSSLESDLRREFKDIWINNRLDLWMYKFKFLSEVNLSVIEDKTERIIKKYGWDKLQPFVKSVVTSIFEEVFYEAIDESMEKWIKLSTIVESIESIDDIQGIFPSTSENSLYNDKYIFGGTPMHEAINQCALRLNNKKFADYSKSLLIISDGEFERFSDIRWTVDLLKKSGVSIACGLISKTPILNRFQKIVLRKSIDGAGNLMELASKFGNSNLNIDYSDLKVTKDHKLCLRINQPKVIKDMIKILLEE